MQLVGQIVCGDYVITMDDKMTLLEKGAVAIDQGKILAVDTEKNILKNYSSQKILSGKNRIVMPGLVNTHGHVPVSYFRGLADDLPLQEWLEKYLWPSERKFLNPEFVYEATQLACLEMIRSGTTSFADMYFYEDEIAQATQKMGMRALLGPTIFDFPMAGCQNAQDHLNQAQTFIETWHKDPLIRPSISAHSIYTCCADTLKAVKAMADKYNVPMQIHVSETEKEVLDSLAQHKMRPAEYLHSLNLLDEQVLMDHCVWFNDHEVDIVYKMKAKVSHCLESNLKLVSGIAPIPAMLERGLHVSLGTDSTASNNDLDLFTELSNVAKVHKCIVRDSTALDAKTTLKMATRWGAEALGFDRVGYLASGCAADLITIDTQQPHLLPLYNIYSQIVYAVHSADVNDLMVNGKWLMQDRNILCVDEQAILEKAKQWGQKIGAQVQGNQSAEAA